MSNTDRNNNLNMYDVKITGFCDAANLGNLEECKKFLALGVSINSIDGYGYAALQRAAQNGHLKLCEFLINKGIDINISNFQGSAYQCAFYNGHNEICELFF